MKLVLFSLVKSTFGLEPTGGVLRVGGRNLVYFSGALLDASSKTSERSLMVSYKMVRMSFV